MTENGKQWPIYKKINGGSSTFFCHCSFSPCRSLVVYTVQFDRPATLNINMDPQSALSIDDSIKVVFKQDRKAALFDFEQKERRNKKDTELQMTERCELSDLSRLQSAIT